MEQLEIRIKRYLLGDLDDDERAELDMKLLTDEEFGVSLELAEEDLIEDYLNSTLTPDESDRFVQHFLLPPQRRRQFELSRKLQDYAKTTMPSSSGAQAAYVKPVLRRFLFGLRPGYSFSVGAAILVIGLGMTYLVWQDRVPRGEDRELVALNRRDLNDLATLSDTTRVTLLPGTTRDSRAVPRISLNSASEIILVRLALPEDLTGKTVSAKFFNKNFSPFELTEAKIYRGLAGNDLRILVPRERFATGSYRIEIVSETEPDLKTEYAFEVEP